MSRRQIVRMLVVASLGFGPAGLSVAPAGAASCEEHWSLIADSTAGFNAIDAVSKNDMWAVGTGIGHWDGEAWKAVSTPTSGTLVSVAALSTANAWAVGSRGTNPLVEHWDGDTWQVVDSPVPSPFINALNGVSATSPNDVWAVGTFYDQSRQASRTLTEHWDGREWTVVPSLSAASWYSTLNAVVAVTPHDVWAVGASIDPGSGVLRTLVEQWDGQRWTMVDSPNVGSGYNSLLGVAATNDAVWAVGYSTGNFANRQPLVERYANNGWEVVDSPSPTADQDAVLQAVTAVSSSNLWAVGYSGSDVQSSLIERWGGGHWVLVRSPNVANNSNSLSGVVALPGRGLWAVGVHQQIEDVSGPSTGTLAAYRCEH